MYKVKINITEIGGSDSYIQVMEQGRLNTMIASFKEFAGKTGRMQTVVEVNNYHNGNDIIFSVNVAGTTRTAIINEFILQEV